MNWFVDASALVKRYIREQGSDWFRREVVNHDLFLSQLTPIELGAALSKRFREGSISRFAFYQARRALLRHLSEREYSIVELSDRVVKEALSLTFTQSLRAYDAVQLATALVTSSGLDRATFAFVTADERLASASRIVGLRTENPTSH